MGVRTVPGAEMWALLQAAQAFWDLPAYRVDCLAVVPMYAYGLTQATAATSLFADPWCLFQPPSDSNDHVHLS